MLTLMYGGAQAESCNQYLQKGRLVLVEGRLKLDSWEDAEGQKRSKHSIVADRVTFLSNQAHDDASSSDSFADQASSATPAADSLDVKPASSAKKSVKASAVQESPAGEVTFSDKKPFEDDLPF